MNWLLIGMVFVLVLCMFCGFKSGFWGTGMMFVLLIILAMMLNIALPTLIENMEVKDEIILGSELSERKDWGYIIPIFPKVIQEKLLQGYSSYGEMFEADKEMAYKLSGLLSSFGVIVVMILALIFGLFVLRPVGELHNKALKLPIFGKIDKIVGVGIGIIDGIILDYMILILIGTYGTTKYGEMLYQMIYQSEALMFLYENNLLIKLLY